MKGFDLTEEPWICCQRADGSTEYLGLRRVLQEAHQLRCLADASPLVLAAQHRLLLAIVYRCTTITSTDEWIDAYEKGRFDHDAIGAYLAKWKHRFDLFHPERPFYQVRGLPFKHSDVGRLVLERSNYGAPSDVFQHRPEGVGSAVNPADAACHLLALHCFAAGGLVKKKDEPVSATAAPFRAAVLFLVHGKSLWETLQLNAVPVDGQDKPIPGNASDMPCWERPAATAIVERKPDGWLDLLTWQSRRLELKTRPDGSVEGVVYCVGQSLDASSLAEPMASFVKTEDDTFRAIGFQADRALFTRAHALIEAHGTDPRDAKAPAALGFLGQRAVRSVVPLSRRFDLLALGVCGDKEFTYFTRAERFPLSVELLEHNGGRAAVQTAIDLCTKVEGNLSHAVWILARHALSPGERSPDTKDIRALLDRTQAKPQFWARAELQFLELLQRLLPDDRPIQDRIDASLKTFARAVERIATDVFESSVRALGSSARILKGAAIAEAQLRISLATTMKPYRTVVAQGVALHGN